MTIKRFTDIRAWQAARALVKAVYLATDEGLIARDFSLRDQLRRAAVSTMSNIAEGFDRGTDPDFARFLDIARASASEVKSLLFACLDTRRLDPDTVETILQHCDKTQALIAGFQDYLRNPKVRDGEDLYSTQLMP